MLVQMDKSDTMMGGVCCRWLTIFSKHIKNIIRDTNIDKTKSSK